MVNLNKVMLIGNLTKDTELRYIPNGAAVAENSIAINKVRVDEQGTKHEETTFVDFVAWNKQAENLNKYQSKGSSIFIEGHLQLDTWDDKESGKKRSRLRVIADRIQYLGGISQTNDQQPPAQQAPANANNAQVPQAPVVTDGECPF